MSTAAECRKLSNKNTVLDHAIENLMASIKICAEKGKDHCRTGRDHKEDLDYWGLIQEINILKMILRK